jgi:hypothetical protein
MKLFLSALATFVTLIISFILIDALAYAWTFLAAPVNVIAIIVISIMSLQVLVLFLYEFLIFKILYKNY